MKLHSKIIFVYFSITNHQLSFPFRTLFIVNRFCLWLGFTVSFGLSLIGNFQLENPMEENTIISQPEEYSSRSKEDNQNMNSGNDNCYTLRLIFHSKIAAFCCFITFLILRFLISQISRQQMDMIWQRMKTK